MEDTIAAVATAYGEGGIGIIRISGEKSLEILKEIFIPASDSDEIIRPHEERLCIEIVLLRHSGDSSEHGHAHQGNQNQNKQLLHDAFPPIASSCTINLLLIAQNYHNSTTAIHISFE